MRQAEDKKLPLSAMSEDQRQRWREYEALKNTIEEERLAQVRRTPQRCIITMHALVTRESLDT